MSTPQNKLRPRVKQPMLMRHPLGLVEHAWLSHPIHGLSALKSTSPRIVKRRVWQSLCTLFFLLCSTLALASVQAIYPFEHPHDQQRFKQLTTQLRCLVCQNQTLADSDAPLAHDLRGQIYQQIQAGHDNEQIVSYLTNRYGTFIRYNPPWSAETWLLWLGPGMILLLGFGVLLYFIRGYKENEPTDRLDSD